MSSNEQAKYPERLASSSLYSHSEESECICHTLKLFYRQCKEDISNCQFSFRKGFGTSKRFSVAQYYFKNAETRGKSPHVVYWLSEDANQSKLIKLLQDMGIDENDLTIIRTLYRSQTAFVRLENDKKQIMLLYN